MRWIKWFEETGMESVAEVGGKNASLGEMIRELTPLGVRVPEGFSITAGAYRYFLEANQLGPSIRNILGGWDHTDVNDLTVRAREIRNLILRGRFPKDLEKEIVDAYEALSMRAGVAGIDVAVRSSATAEDLPDASFAGQQESFLMVHGDAQVLDATRKAMASLFTARAINYREDMGFDHFDVALSVGVQRMVRSDLESSGVIFTLDTESGFTDVVFINSIWGLGENIVQGRVTPDEFYVHKPTLALGYDSLISRRIGTKELTLTYDVDTHRLVNQPTPPWDQMRPSLADDEVIELAKWAVAIEDHYSAKRGQPTPMDLEWAKDGATGELFVVQARPETVHSQREGPTIQIHSLVESGPLLVTGLAVGDKVAVGRASIIDDPSHMNRFQAGDVLVTEITDPDWEPIMKAAAGIITERGGRTSHAAIVARELGIPAVVGAVGARSLIGNGQEVTIDCTEADTGRVYAGILEFTVQEIDPASMPRPRTQIMLNVGDPGQAFTLGQLPVDGVGLTRMEFIFAGFVRVHPLALTRYRTLPTEVRGQIDELTAGYSDKSEYFVDKLSQGIGTIAAAFYPRPVILRFSDFKSNEYAHLLGGEFFEPTEENPMIGWRGASRYYDPSFREGFLLEVASVRRVRERMGLTNLAVMVPFCRTPDEGRQVLEVMKEGGLVQGQDGLEVYVMAEIPANALSADEFAEVFDGFSIGSNDLTQLVLGVDRDSEKVARLFDERNPAVKRACAMVIEGAKRHGKKVGICGQAPSDYPDFAAFLVEQGIDSVSLTADALLATVDRVSEAEANLTMA